MFRTHTEVFRTPVSSDDKIAKCSSCKCDFCDQEWQSESEVFIHKRKHFTEEKLKKITANHSFCWTCIRNFETQPDFIEHYKECHLLSSPDAKQVEREIYVCNSCTAILFNKKMLEVHLICHRKRKVKREIECVKCERNIDIKYMWQHALHHNMIGVHVCPICFTKYSDWHSLKQHLNEHPHYLHCNMCGDNYETSSAYNEHFKKHVYEPKTNEDEDEDMDTYDKYFIHLTTTQFRKKLTPYIGLRLQEELTICVLCREICTTYNERRNHILNHQLYKGKKLEDATKITQPDKLELICSCGDIFSNRVLFKQHLFRNRDSEIIHFSV